MIPWHTLTDGFDANFGVDGWHGTNAFIRDDDREAWEDSPEGYPQTPPYQWWDYSDASRQGTASHTS